MIRLFMCLCLAVAVLASPLRAQEGPLRIEITEGVIEPMPVAVPDFIAETPAAAQFARDIAEVVRNNLAGSGLFRPIPSNAFIGQITSFNSPVQYADWKAINAQALAAIGESVLVVNPLMV